MIEDCRRLNIGEVFSESISSAESLKNRGNPLFSGVFFYVHQKLASGVSQWQTKNLRGNRQFSQ